MTRVRRIALSLGVAVALLGGVVAVVPPLLLGDRTDYGVVVSIAESPSYQDPALLAEAWRLPVARTFGPEGVTFQQNPSFCGPTSVVNVMRSLGEAGDSHANLARVLEGLGARTVLGILPGGLTLDQLADLARLRTGKRVTVLRDLDLDAFRAEMRRANDPSVRYLVNFSRKPLFGRGGGHHSPIAGYLEARDLVLVVDVNEKYRPWLVPTERLWKATRTIDSATKRERGLLRIE